MREVFSFQAAECLPEPAAVLRAQGIGAGRDPGDRTRGICSEALDLLAEVVVPRAVYSELPVEAFAPLYAGEGRNDNPSPLAVIAPRATRLALFALTLGPQITERIDALLGGRDFALGAMLDSAASEAAERVAELLERSYLERAELAPGEALLRYSPGYCGWHISGQGRLFAELRPGDIGLTLRESHLMQPLKSISGLIVRGPAEIHLFNDDFSFCEACRTHECRSRIKDLGGAPKQA